jgi:hypothetical protein
MRTTLLTALFCAAALAQPTPIGVAVDGTVLPLRGPTTCQQGETHYLECTDVYLKSTSVNLVDLEGQTVRLLGVDSGLGRCHVVDVRSYSRPGGLLTWVGSPNPGCPITFTICGSGLGAYYLFLGSGPAYLPVDMQFGTILIAPPWILLQSGHHGGCTDIRARIPPERILIGLSLHFQGVVQDVGPIGPPRTTNPICFTIEDGPRCP